MSARQPNDPGGVSLLLQIEQACESFDQQWKDGARPRIEQYLADHPAPGRSRLLAELLAAELHYRRAAGEEPREVEYLNRFPEEASLVREQFHKAAADQPTQIGAEGDQAAATQEMRAEDPAATQLATPRGGKRDYDPQATIAPTDSYAYTQPAQVRFAKLRPHREGGLGAVLIAQDAEVPRQVALKEMRSEIADDELARQQFLFEARVTGALEHPGVVPVYGCGVYPDGRPYYAMRFVEGDDLHDVTIAFHRRRKAQASDAEVNLELRQLLGRIITVAQVLDYAHSRGVVHRDLKPKNIMVGAYGETLVVDWGLAKQIDDATASESVHAPTASVVPLSAALSESLEASMMGTVKGTISYMSPEQALGRVDLAGPAMDIYGLGATLYHMLAGEPPGSTVSRGDLLRYVQKGQLPRLREVASWVPRPLEAICSKAMALAPSDRYASAGELARDIERWLADEPVSAMPEPWTAQAARWLRRHRTWAAAAMASLLIIAAVMGVSLWWVNGARRDERDARREATRLLATARETTDSLLHAASEQLKDIPEAEDVRRRLLLQAADSYRDFLDMRPTDPDLREQAGLLQIRLAEVQRELGQLEEAAGSLRSAADEFRSLIEEDHRTLTTQLGLARALHHTSEVATDRGQLRPATTAIQQAMAELTGLVQEHPRRGGLLAARGKARIQQGIVAHDHDDWPAAVRAFEMALADLRTAADLLPGEASSGRAGEVAAEVIESKFSAAKAAVNLGHALSRTAAPAEEVERAYRAALRDAAEVFSTDPAEARFADLLALAEQNLAAHLLQDEKPEEAAKVYQESNTRYQRLVERHPRIPRYRYGLILSLVGLAAASEEQQTADGQQHLRDAIAESDVLAELTKSLDAFRDGIVLPRWTLAKQLAEAKRWQEAAEIALGIPDELKLELAMPSEEAVGAEALAVLHYNAACHLSQMAASIDDAAARERLFQRALQELRTADAVHLGRDAWVYAAEDPDLQPLVKRHPDVVQSHLKAAPEVTR